MERDTDIVESLIRGAGRRTEPPRQAYLEVYGAAHAAFRRKASQRRERTRLLWVAAAAALVLTVGLVALWSPPAGQRGELARIARVIGTVESATGDRWTPLGEQSDSPAAGVRIRTGADGRLALALPGGESLRLAGSTEIMLDAPGRLYLASGMIYVDSGPRPAMARLEIVTPAGTAHDLGTQFELAVAGPALRLRVREGMVSIDRGGRSLAGQAGEQISIDGFGSVSRARIPPDDPAWHWAEAIAPMPDMDGRPAATLIAWVARETGRRIVYESPEVEQRAADVILHGDIRHLPPVTALEAMLATTDLTVLLDGDTMEVRSRSPAPPVP